MAEPTTIAELKEALPGWIVEGTARGPLAEINVWLEGETYITVTDHEEAVAVRAAYGAVKACASRDGGEAP